MEIVYWNDKFDRFVTSLDRITSSQVINILDLLKDRRNLLDMPDSKSLGKGLLELRTNGKVKVRILYIFHNNKAVIVNYFVKKT
jgi:phage-related protein